MSTRIPLRPGAWLALAAASLFGASTATAQKTTDMDFAARFEKLKAKGAATASSDSLRLHQLFALSREYGLHEFPEWATYDGYKGQNDRWTDMSIEAKRRRERELEWPRSVLTTIDRSKLSADDRLNYDLFKLDIDQWIESNRYPDDYMPVNHRGGVHLDVPGMMEVMPTATVKDYEDILARLRSVPEVVDQTLVLMKEGLKMGVTPPQVTLRHIPEQILNVIPSDPLQSPILLPFNDFPASIPAAEQKRLRDAAIDIYTGKIVPSFQDLHGYMTKTYIPSARTSIGMSTLPNGKEWYTYRARTSTTTDMTPQQIHDLGLSEVKRIRGEMQKIIDSLGFKGSFQEFVNYLRTDPQFFHKDSASLIAGYRDIAKRADPELIKLFGKLPRMQYGVVAIPTYQAKAATTAYYMGGSHDAGRPGYFYANTYNLQARPKWEMEALTLHEAVPGHHLQISIAEELENVPQFRQDANYTAFVEGWGLYAESLGEEMGFYQDPYSKFGQLTYEMWRAIRLVVDTGIHWFGWSREDAVRYFTENSGKTEHDIGVEVDRYIIWPGQALAYKIGELKIKELRKYATAELGDDFDIREFHDHVLGSGAVPLEVLERKIKEWVAAKKRNRS